MVFKRIFIVKRFKELNAS